MIQDTEGSNETIVRGEMVDTPPGWVATACCPKGDAGTWENLCPPLSLESTFRLYITGGLCGTPLETKPNLLTPGVARTAGRRRSRFYTTRDREGKPERFRMAKQS